MKIDDKIPFFRITSQKKITSYPYTIKVYFFIISHIFFINK